MCKDRYGLTPGPSRWCAGVWLAVLPLLLGFGPAAFAQASPGRSQPLITQSINEGNLVVLSGNTRPEARDPANDQGNVSDTLPLPHMMLQLRRPPAQEQAIVTLIDQLHDRKSPNFHHWLTAAEIGAQFGPATSDIQTITGWLAQHGFIVNTVYRNAMVIDYSGTAGQVRSAFHTEIHNLSVNGVAHIANMTDPQIPAALAPAIAGPLGLNDFRPHTGFVPIRDYNGTGSNELITPGDLAVIYNFNPLFQAGITGQGQTIYIVDHSDLYQSSDWSTFRSTFGIPLSNYPSASLSTLHPLPPSGPPNCSDPGVTSASGETTLDAEYASAAAPSAAIVLVVCADASVSGNLIAIENLVNGSSFSPAIISNSHLDCEAHLGAATNAAIYSAFQTGVAEGVSIYSAAGDQSAAMCDVGEVATHGINVNGFASTPYNVAVGGTDFADTYEAKFGGNPLSTYWSQTNNPSNYSSALAYIPEIPWNSTCGSQLVADYNGYSATFGSSGYCNSGVSAKLLNTTGGGGGPSGCASGSTSNSSPDVVSGTCAGYPNPEFQNVLGMPNNGVRNIPDVSMFAANGRWGHYYVYCWSDPNGGAPCTGPPSGWSGAGGTSFGAPIWAGIQALINQYVGGKQGNPNYRLYSLAAAEYGASGTSTCNSSNGFTLSSPNYLGTLCIFYDVNLLFYTDLGGDNDVPCQANANGNLYNCYLPSGTYGVLSTSNSSYAPAYQAAAGWDFATGLGTVNVYNLVTNWHGLSLTSTHDFKGNGGSYIFPGTSDILFRSTGASPTTVGMWLMNGSSTQSSGSVASVPNTYSIVGQRDFNGDGKADLLWRDSSGNLSIWFMNGLTMTSSAAIGNVPTNWTVYGTGNCIGGGIGDLLWLDTAGDVAVWYLSGGTFVTSQALGNVGTSWSIVGSDARCDILWRDTSYNYAIWMVNGGNDWMVNQKTIQSASLGNVPSNWVMAGAGDFNGDGNIDILWHDSISGTVAIWYLNSAGEVQSTASVAAVPPSTYWTIVQTGDYNGDGHSDILWADRSGNLAIWFMFGSNIASTAGLGNIGTTWQVQTVNSD